MGRFRGAYIKDYDYDDFGRILGETLAFRKSGFVGLLQCRVV